MRLHSLTPALFALLLAACGGGGSGSPGPGGTDVQGLAGPSGVSIVSPDESNVAPGGSGGGGSPGLTWPAGSAYLTDVATVHVYDPSMEALQQGNSILCMVTRTGYAEMVNTGPYIAQVDEDLCSQGQEPTSTSGESSAQERRLMFFTTRATRLNSTAPQVNHFWVPANGPGETEALIYAAMTVSAAPTTEDPFGTFQLNWAGVEGAGSVEDPLMWGFLKSDELAYPGFEFFEESGDVDVPAGPDEYSSRTAVHVSVNPETQRGAARIRVIERYNFGGGDSGQLTSDWRVVFNDTHMKRRRDGDPESTVSRVDFTDRVYRYNLYHAEGDQLGQRVALNSGFNIQAETGEYGWAGYHGIWMPPGVELADGDTVTRRQPGSSTSVPYTVDQSPGRLVRFQRGTLALSALAGQVFEWWGGGERYRVDYSVSDFRRIARWNMGLETWEPIEPPTVIDVGANGGFLNMWSQTLGGPVTYVDGADAITFFEEEFIDPADEVLSLAVGGEVALYGYVNCLRSGILGSEAEQGDIYLPFAAGVSTPHVFRFNAEDLTLRHDPNGDGSVLNIVGLADGESPTFGPNTWGMRSGPMVTSTAGLVNTSDIWSVDTFYVYETGHNPWNQRVGLLDSLGQAVEFDRPLEFLYTHATANDMNGDSTYDGQVYFLSYNGPGNLHGVPFEGVDLNGDSNPDRWYPLFSIKDGTLLGPTGTEYVIRAVEVEQTLNEDVGGAPSLDLSLADGLTLPDGSGYVTPNIGARPTVNDPPAVIDGVVQ